MGCVTSKMKSKNKACEEDLALLLAAQTPFSVGEVEALYELFSKLSNSVMADGLIQREEFQLALFGDKTQRNIFADRIFDVFDVKRDGVIEFGEFVRSLAIFHPRARIEDKLSFAFRLYDIRQSGFIERDELKEMVVMFLHESDICIPDEIVEIIIDKTMSESDAKGDGKIDPEEWKEFVLNHPSVLQHMTLPYLIDLTLAFPSFRERRRRRLPPNEDIQRQELN